MSAHAQKPPTRVCIYAPNWVGEAVMALPFLNACHQAHPEAHITVVATSWVVPVFVHHPLVDDLVIIPGRGFRGLRDTTRFGLVLRRHRFQYFYLLPESLRSAYLSWLARSEERIGLKTQFRSIFLTRPVRPPGQKLHLSVKHLYLLPRPDDPHSDSRDTANGDIGITLLAEEGSRAARTIQEMGLSNPLAVMPGSMSPSRSVPVEIWLDILRPIVKGGQQVLLIGGPGDRAIGESLVERLDSPGVRSACGRFSLRESMALISQCQGAVSADTGLAHIAANLGVRTVTLFGAGDERITRPLGPRARIVREPVYCSPCRKNICPNRKEPLLCLQALPDQAVRQAWLELQSEQ